MPPLPVPPPWQGLPLTPARMRWRVRRNNRTVRSWHTRVGLAHVLSLSSLLWGLGLVAHEVLPRIGYAAKTLAWTCS